jgi:hypothetical protein
MIRLTECQNCGVAREEDQLHEVRDIFQRVAAGEPMPAGECPDCGAICHLIKQGDTPVQGDTQGDTPTPPREWLYRAMEIDTDGDPYDFGVVKAETLDEAMGLLKVRLTDLAIKGEFHISLYPVTGYDVYGFLITGHRTELSLVVGDDEDDD